ncbi:MAG: hypothetical protein DI566_14115 [Microbacterium sp.]|nr:MAG: hypothetical protein DI566_14115 [Microbacterium sp.]
MPHENADTPDPADVSDAEARHDDLLSALEVIEQQPLAERANAYAALHDDLARRLESGPRDHHL